MDSTAGTRAQYNLRRPSRISGTLPPLDSHMDLPLLAVEGHDRSTGMSATQILHGSSEMSHSTHLFDLAMPTLSPQLDLTIPPRIGRRQSIFTSTGIESRPSPNSPISPNPPILTPVGQDIVGTPDMPGCTTTQPTSTLEIHPGWPLATRVAFSESKMAAKMVEILRQNLAAITVSILNAVEW